MKTKHAALLPPKHLRTDTAAWFTSIIKGYELDPHHLKLLIKACEAWDRSEKACEAIAKHGMTYEDRFGAPRARPTAEQQFADIGFDAASLRQIALQADVPVALVSYHFKGKLGLYREVFRSRYPTIVEQRKAGLALAQMEDDPVRRPEMILKAVLIPMRTLRSLEGSRNFGVLLAREAHDPKSAERGIIQEIFDPVALATIDLLKQTLPSRSKAEIVWSFQTIIGTMFYIMADSGRAERLSGGACDPDDVDATLRYILPLLLNGVRGGN
jgi:AcrR family transcriptional regulator